MKQGIGMRTLLADLFAGASPGFRCRGSFGVGEALRGEAPAVSWRGPRVENQWQSIAHARILTKVAMQAAVSHRPAVRLSTQHASCSRGRSLRFADGGGLNMQVEGRDPMRQSKAVVRAEARTIHRRAMAQAGKRGKNSRPATSRDRKTSGRREAISAIVTAANLLGVGPAVPMPMPCRDHLNLTHAVRLNPHRRTCPHSRHLSFYRHSMRQ